MTERRAMHEHEVPEASTKSPKTTVQRASVPGSDLLSLQRLAGNSAVTQRIQRADVEIEEMTSHFDVRDSAKVGPGLRSEVTKAVHGMAGAGETGEEQPPGPAEESTPAPTEEQQAPGGADVLPQGGHATMEEEPG